jgi:hypothetical protein
MFDKNKTSENIPFNYKLMSLTKIIFVTLSPILSFLSKPSKNNL